ncbi:NdufA6 NADH-ubiquinone oxidoreductase 14.8 kDa subunit [Exidia glandulosa HHB12029]|uniref:NdufA6 NADH-ubiquinone oxidoreductase 14.8 kDa subunit n=1 Tax=Exidia glandulosa HHB12029 TaxID=1314781 RepID=A0A165EBD8_EXIGL|nr:NdufA6 NADH-ubiquinone oxidoreductase 14.8 kDa subunit [Exidia glandulosa HHB12029]
MTTIVSIPSRLARATHVSGTLDVARARARVLYREWYRAAPEIVTVYALPLSAVDIRAWLRREFEKNRHITDPKVIDVLTLKGRQEYQETINTWKEYPHVMTMFTKGMYDVPQKPFMQKFLEGRDEEALVPASPP